MAIITISGNTSGSISLSAPDISGSNTLTLPVATDTLIGKATTDTLTNKSIAATQLTGTIAAAAMPAGSVLQVVNASTSTEVSNATNTYVDTGLTATITPRSASSKIFVIVSQLIFKSSANAGNQSGVRLVRDATDLGLILAAQLYTNTAIEFYGNGGFNYLDSPATTSATTYKTQFNNNNNTSAAIVQRGNVGKSTITLMEIQG